MLSSDMKKLTFVFSEEVFGAFQHGDWRKQDEVETAIENFLCDMNVEEIRSDGDGYERCAITKASFDTRNVNRDNGNDEFLVLKIQDVEPTDKIPDAYLFSSNPIYITIEHGDKLVLKKRGSVVYVGLE